MSLKWVDVLDIAIELSERKPDVDPRYVNFVDLHRLSLIHISWRPSSRHWAASSASPA